MKADSKVTAKVKLSGLLSTVLLMLLFVTQPGEAIPRFVAFTRLQTAENAMFSDDMQTEKYDPLSIIRSEGLRQVSLLLELFPGARSIALAGGIIADIDDKTALGLREQTPDIIIESLDSSLSTIKTYWSADTTHLSGEAPPPWNHTVSGVDVLKESGLTGRGTHIGIIARNFYYEHTALAGKITHIKHFGLASEARNINDLHLVHPLGILAGLEEDRYSGIAPETDISLALLSGKPVKTDMLLEAVEWILQQEQRPDIILFCTDFSTSAPAAVARILFACRNAGIIPVVAAGNNPSQITGMAALPCCITVGAVDRWKQRALFSGQGPVIYENAQICKPDFCEPGSAISGPAENNTYKLGSGTLQAAAHFAGTFLLMRQAMPTVDPEYVITAIKATTQDLGAPGMDNETGLGLPSPSAALEYIINPPVQN